MYTNHWTNFLSSSVKMSQRIEKGTKFTPAMMGGISSRRRPNPNAAGPSSSSNAGPSQPQPQSQSSRPQIQQQQQRRPSTSSSQSQPTRSYVQPSPASSGSAGGSKSMFTPGSSNRIAASPSASTSASASALPRPTFKPPTLSSTPSNMRRPSTSHSNTTPQADGAQQSESETTARAVENDSRVRSRLPPAFGKSSSKSAFLPKPPPQHQPQPQASQQQQKQQGEQGGEKAVAPAPADADAGPQSQSQAETTNSQQDDNQAGPDAALSNTSKDTTTSHTQNGTVHQNEFAQQPALAQKGSSYQPPVPSTPATAAEPSSIVAAPVAESSGSSSRGHRQQSSAVAGPSRISADEPVPQPKKSKATSTSSTAPSRRSKLPEGHPARPLTAYFIFLAEQRPILRDEQPDKTVSQIAKLCGEKWRSLSEQVKSSYEKEAAEDKHRYQEQLQSWKDATPNWEELLSSTQGEASQPRKRSKRKGGPKRAPSAYLLFAQEQRSHLSEHRRKAGSDAESAKKAFADMNKHIADSWKALDSEQRAEFTRRSDELKNKYDEELAAWKESHPDGQTSGTGEEDSATNVSSDDQNGSHTRRPRRSTGPRTEEKSITDEEKEYEALLAEHAERFEPLQLDTNAINMSDLTGLEYKHGLASKRTFELDRVRKKQLEEGLAVRTSAKERLKEKRRLMKENLRKRRNGEEVILPRYDPRTDMSSGRRHLFDATSHLRQRDDEENESKNKVKGGDDDDNDEEIIDGDVDDVEEELGGRPQDAARGQERENGRFQIPDLDDDEVEDDDRNASNSGGRRRLDARSEAEDNSSDADSDDDDGGSVKSGTSIGTHHSLRDNAHAPQMRMVDGKMVLDESSLQIDRSGGPEIIDEDEIFEEEPTHKFVNTFTSSKREKVARWNEKETLEFFRAVSMWGTDFEMISRMFTNRTRKQIKAKWTKEERTNTAKLNEAFNKKTPVNLDDYAIMANVDLSGPAPIVSVNGKTEADLASNQPLQQEGGEEEEEGEGETDGGNEIRRFKKTSQTPDPFSRKRSGSTSGISTSESNKRSKNERDQRKAREKSRRSGQSTGNNAAADGRYEMVEEEVDEPPPE
ncbi:unnamed protein product [Sympodiomycopsis kandeliae]